MRAKVSGRTSHSQESNMQQEGAEAAEASPKQPLPSPAARHENGDEAAPPQPPAVGAAAVASPANGAPSPRDPEEGQPLVSNVLPKQQQQQQNNEFLQQQSQIFVFSTALANQGADAVVQQHFPSIIAFHCAQPGTKKYLEVRHRGTKSPSFFNVCYCFQCDTVDQ